MGTNHVIVDYGMGNLHSVVSALRYLGVDPMVSGDPLVVQDADVLVLPGVGSFRKAMGRLETSGLADAMREAALAKKRKIIGICLGQQLMAEYGTEDGGANGLGFFSGVVQRIPAPDTGALKVPHVGFNKVRFEADSRLFRGFDAPVDCYFVHSYRLEVQNRPGIAALCDYGGDFVAAYEYQNIFCTQFHPEKSQTNGLKILSNFLSV
jgi:glutamine amidotransferase